ncbi:hypothetical protein QYE76_071205 [Lolium multiflorum]|uniref:Uncharacterized protein n=1 Tax=Lolium multiflorum TaxID=4521 RepID=A0AAD8SLW9_LOLMU|nr:hypothetical protein QYE76_071205 [Lolium multiflorum]
MEPHVRATLTDLCNVFDVITRKSITIKKLGRLQEEIVTILCEMEMYFPPAFFDIMVHLLVHIVDDIEDLGPAFLHNMMALERMNGFIKGYVRNRAHPDGSIVQGFLTEECISFCKNYLNEDDPRPVGLPANKHLGRFEGVGHNAGRREIDADQDDRRTDFNRAHLVALQHMNEVEPWVDQHINMIKSMADKPMTEQEVFRAHNSFFASWFKDQIDANPPPMASDVDKMILALSYGPAPNLMTYQKYDINGYTFSTEERDKKSDYQNSGVTMESCTGEEKKRYYGRIEEIWELDYVGEKLPMFRVRWATDVTKEDAYVTTMRLPPKSKTKNPTAQNEPWVLAKHVEQCFFITDPSRPSRVVLAMSSSADPHKDVDESSQRKLDEHYRLMVSDQLEDLPGSDDESSEEGDDEMDNDGEDERGAADETTDSGVAGGSSDTTTEAKRKRKQRRPNRVGTTRDIITAVDAKTGIPTEPKHVAKGYGLQLGAILRDVVDVNETKLRTKKKQHLQAQLLARLHARYEFPVEYRNEDTKDNIVNRRALSKFSKNLSGYKTMLRGMLGNNETWEEIHRHFPRMTLEQYNKFLENEELEYTKRQSTWGKELADKNIGPDTTRELAGKRVTKPDVVVGVELVADAKVMALEKAVLTEQAAAESAGSSSQTSTGKVPWDTPFIRGLNTVKARPLLDKPHRVPGAGGGRKLANYGLDVPASTRESRQAQKDREHEALLKKVADLETMMEQRVSAEVDDVLANRVNEIIPDLVLSMKNYFDAGGKGPMPVISLGASNSDNRPPTRHAQCTPNLVTPPAGNVGAREDSPDLGGPSTSPSVTCTPDLGPSTRAELDALTENATPCTLLLNVDNKLKAVASGSVILPTQRIFHCVRMDDSAKAQHDHFEPDSQPESQHDKALDIDQAPIDTFIAELDADAVSPYKPPAGHILKKKLFLSQETPEQEDTTAFTAPPRVGLTPRTLLGATTEGMKQNATPSCSKKKGRKRKKSGDVAKSKIVVNDKLPTPWRKLHHIGQPMLPAHVVDKLTPDMRNVHETILMKEKLLLKERNPSYPIVIAKVPTGFGFVNTYPADLMFIRYEDIFRLLHMQQLDRNLVRLVSLSMAHDIAMENTAHIAIMDPFYMTPATTQNEQAFLAKYIKDFLVLNKDKKCFVIPYFRELKYCTLLLFHPYHSHVTYLDSGLDKEKDFTDVKSTLDKALSGFIAEIGVDKLRHEKKVKGCHVCNHITKFPCLKQSADDNGMEAWFAILQMRAVVRSQNDLLLPSGLQGNFVNISDTTDENMTYYVVYHGRVPGVYEDWEDCRRQVHRFSGNSYKGYTTLEEAETRYANFRAGQRREMWRTPFIVMLLAATASLVYYEVESSSSKLEGAIKFAAEARTEIDTLKEELKEVKQRLKDEEAAKLTAEARALEKDELLRQSSLALLKAADIPVEALDKVPSNSRSNALSMTLASHQLAQDLLQKGKGAMARIHSMIFPKISQAKTLGQLIDAFAVNTREVIERVLISRQRRQKNA